MRKKHNKYSIECSYSIDKKYINIYHKKSNTNWLVNNLPAVESILKSNCTHFIYEKNANKRLRVMLTYNGKSNGKLKPYFAPLMYFCYRQGVNAKNLHNLLPKRIKELKKEELTIDHLDANKYNNTIYNLIPMHRIDNLKKSTKSKRFKGIFGLILANDGERIRVQFTYLANAKKGDLKAMRWYCETPEELNELINYLLVNKWKLRQQRIGEPNDNQLYTVTERCQFTALFCRIQPTMIMPELQRALAELPIEKFTKWEIKK